LAFHITKHIVTKVRLRQSQVDDNIEQSTLFTALAVTAEYVDINFTDYHCRLLRRIDLIKQTFIIERFIYITAT